MSFGQRLRDERLKKRFTQAQLTEAAGIHYIQFGHYENKGSVPAADVLSRLADALGVSGDFLVNGTSDQHAAGQLTDHELLARFR